MPYAHALWKGERDRILIEAKKGKSEERVAAQADLAALGVEPAAPSSPDRVVTEPTFEGLTRLYLNGQPSLGIFSDEGGQFLGGHAMNSDNRQKTLTALNDLWQGNGWIGQLGDSSLCHVAYPFLSRESTASEHRMICRPSGHHQLSRVSLSRTGIASPVSAD